jgi:hypothetical protein
MTGYVGDGRLGRKRKCPAPHQDALFLLFVCGLAPARKISMKSCAIELSVRFLRLQGRPSVGASEAEQAAR